MKQSETLFYDVVNAKGLDVQFKILGYSSALRWMGVHERAFSEKGPHRIRLTRPQPSADEIMAEWGLDSAEEA